MAKGGVGYNKSRGIDDIFCQLGIHYWRSR